MQLRQDDAGGRLFNIVGFQTRLKWGEQRRVFRTIPGLENADFARMGVMHRNTYLPSNRMLEATMRIRAEAMRPSSSRDSSPASRATSERRDGPHRRRQRRPARRGEAPLTMPRGTMMGALAHYITTKEGTLQPINPTGAWSPPHPRGRTGAGSQSRSGGSARAGWRSTCWRSSSGRKSERLVSQQKPTGLT